MSAPTTTPPTTGGRDGLTLARVVRSERIKLLSLRSTWWTLALTLAGVVGIAVLLAVVRAATGGVGGPTDVTALTTGVLVGQIPVAVLGVLTITGEHATGAVRATMTAVPRRVPVLVAKAVVLAATAFLLGVVGVLLSALATLPLYGADAPSLLTGTGARVVVGTGLYLAGVALLGLALGWLVRSSAGGVALVLGVLLFLPSLLQVLGSVVGQEWLVRSAAYLPGEAGARVAALGPGELGPWEGLGVMALWLVVLLGAAAVVLRRRDV